MANGDILVRLAGATSRVGEDTQLSPPTPLQASAVVGPVSLDEYSVSLLSGTIPPGMAINRVSATYAMEGSTLVGTLRFQLYFTGIEWRIKTFIGGTSAEIFDPIPSGTGVVHCRATLSNITSLVEGVVSGIFVVLQIDLGQISEATYPSGSPADFTVSLQGHLPGEILALPNLRLASGSVSPILPASRYGSSWRIYDSALLGGFDFAMAYNLVKYSELTSNYGLSVTFNRTAQTAAVTIRYYTPAGSLTFNTDTISYATDSAGYRFFGPAGREAGLILYVDTAILRSALERFTGNNTYDIFFEAAGSSFYTEFDTQAYSGSTQFYYLYLYNYTSSSKTVTMQRVTGLQGNAAVGGSGSTDSYAVQNASMVSVVGDTGVGSPPTSPLTGTGTVTITIPANSYARVKHTIPTGATVPSVGVSGLASFYLGS